MHLERANGTEKYLSAFANGSVYLFHNGDTKLSTTSSGIDVTGDIQASGNIKIGTTDVITSARRLKNLTLETI